MTSSRADPAPITSLEHPLVKVARSLHAANGRRRHHACLVEGRRLVEAATQGVAPSVVLHSNGFARADAPARALVRRLLAAGATVREVSDEVLASVSDTVHPQGIVAVVPLPYPRTHASPWDAPLAVVLDAIGDPGNAGTLVRVAAGVGAGVVAITDTTDLWAPKAIRAGAGAHFATTVRTHVAWDECRRALPNQATIIVTDAHAQETVWDVDLTGPVGIVVSNEAHGASAGARRNADRIVRIPQVGGDSLNAAVAGSVVLYEVVRQRMRAGSGMEPRSPGRSGQFPDRRSTRHASGPRGPEAPWN